MTYGIYLIDVRILNSWYSTRKKKNEEIIIYKFQLRLIMRHMRRKSFCWEKNISSSWYMILFISNNSTDDYGETEMCKSATHNVITD